MAFSHELAATDEELRQRFANLRFRSDVARLLEVEPSYLMRALVVRRLRSHYKRFTIRKRSGGERSISAPPSALAVLQSKLNRVLHIVFAPKPCVHGFVKRRNILTNAKQHAGRRWVLNVDLRDFFPSIHFGRVYGAFRASPFYLPDECAQVLAQLCTINDGELPQGAPTSPIIANIVAARLDGELMGLASRYRLVYTRYCDDLSFSTRQQRFPQEIAMAAAGWTGEQVIVGAALRELIESNGFVVNPTKTRLQLREGRQEVTGLTVNAFPNVPRKYIRQIRVALALWRRFGIDGAAAIHSQKMLAGMALTADAFARRIRGQVEHVRMVRGTHDPVYCRLRRELHRLQPDLIGDSPAVGAYPPHAARNDSDVWTRLFQRLGPRIMHLVAVNESGDLRGGSAFAFGNGKVATAAHNLEVSQAVTLDPDGAALGRSVALIHRRGAREVDVALLEGDGRWDPVEYSERIPSPGENIAIIGFASVPSRQPGQGLFVGTVESIRTNHARSTDFIQVSVHSGGGLSGAPLLDRNGRVLGVVIESAYELTAAGVPSREFCTVLPTKYLLEVLREPLTETLPLQVTRANQLRLL